MLDEALNKEKYCLREYLQQCEEILQFLNQNYEEKIKHDLDFDLKILIKKAILIFIS